MTLRKPLRMKIETAWTNCIREDFDKGRLNSERSLQAAFWFRLTQQLEGGKKRRQIFIEPLIVLPNQQRVFPDLIICDSRRIIGILELKYQPRKMPSPNKDLNTLTALWNCRGTNIGITNRRNFVSDEKRRTFKIAENPLLVWAGVHSLASEPIKRSILPVSSEQQRWFVRLHAESQSAERAIISSHLCADP